MSKILTIINKELKGHLDNLGGYFLIGLVLVLSYYFFLQTFFVNSEVTVGGLFSDLSWIFCVFVAAITMNSFAGEKDKATLEYLLTKPVNMTQLLSGKILGNFFYALIPLALTLPIPIFVSQFGQLDWGEVLLSYFAAVLLIFSLTCIGVAISALVKKPVFAFLLTAVVLLFLNLVSSSFFAINLDPATASFLAQFGLMSHYLNLTRGVLTINDVIYFIFLSTVAVLTGYLSIYFWRFNKMRFPIWQVVLTIFLVGLLGYLSVFNPRFFQAQFDLTSRQRYTLSPVTKDVLRDAGKVKVELYLTENLPSQFQSTVQEIKSTLHDYSLVAGKNFELKQINPNGKEKELADLGITPTPFSIVSQNNFQQQQGFLAAVIKNEDGSKSQVVNFAQVKNIDYELTRAINQLKTNSDKPKIGYLQGYGEIDFTRMAPSLNQNLSSNFIVEEVKLKPDSEETDDAKKDQKNTKKAASKTSFELPDLKPYRALIITQPEEGYPQTIVDALQQYYNHGGKILFLFSGNQVNPQLMMAETTSMKSAVQPTDAAVVAPANIFSSLGLDIEYNLIGDYKAYSLVSIAQSSIGPYPYWPRAQAVTKQSSNLAELPAELTLFWPSSLKIKPDTQWQPLYTSTSYALATASAEMINVEPADPKKPVLGTPGQYVFAATKSNESGGQIVAFSNSLLFHDQLLSNSPLAQSNYVAAMSLIEQLTAAQKFSTIQARQIGNPRFILDQNTASRQPLVQFGAPLLSFICLGGVGYSRFWRRRQLNKKLQAL